MFSTLVVLFLFPVSLHPVNVFGSADAGCQQDVLLGRQRRYVHRRRGQKGEKTHSRHCLILIRPLSCDEGGSKVFPKSEVALASHSGGILVFSLYATFRLGCDTAQSRISICRQTCRGYQLAS